MSSNMAKNGEIVLSYYNSLLRTKDVALLEGPHWINDAVIGFYFEYLNEKFSRNKEKEVHFICPELTQLLKMTDPLEYDIFLDPLNVSECKYIFFPLNNCSSVDVAGGSHWSLLVLCKENKTCYHFDSSRGNTFFAYKFAKKLMDFVLSKNKHDNKYIEVNCPQQDNDYDCGIFVLCLADVVMGHITKTGMIDGCNYSHVKEMTELKRTQLLHLIDELRCVSSNNV